MRVLHPGNKHPWSYYCSYSFYRSASLSFPSRNPAGSYYESFQKIATELENGDLSLEDSVSKFEEGMKLSKQCNDLLENAEKRITILLKDGEETKEESFVQEEE